MRDDLLDKIVSSKVYQRSKWTELFGVSALTFLLGFGMSTVLFLRVLDSFSLDDIAKLVEIAACSTGEPASSIWYNVQNQNAVEVLDRIEMVKTLLVEIDTSRCAIVGEASYTNTYKREVWASSPHH